MSHYALAALGWFLLCVPPHTHVHANCSMLKSTRVALLECDGLRSLLSMWEGYMERRTSCEGRGKMISLIQAVLSVH